MQEQQDCMLIHSEKTDGQRFRPSDWVERLSSSVARFDGDRRLRYDKSVHPVVVDGRKCLFVSPRLERRAPQLYAHIVAFAAHNGLRIEQGSCRELAA